MDPALRGELAQLRRALDAIDARLRRLAETRGWTAKEVEARECAQMSLTEKATRADFAVDNSGSPEELERQIDAIWRMLV